MRAATRQQPSAHFGSYWATQLSRFVEVYVSRYLVIPSSQPKHEVTYVEGRGLDTAMSIKDPPDNVFSTLPGGNWKPFEGFGLQRSKHGGRQARRNNPASSEITRNAKNTKKSICAMPADVPAMPPKPSAPAMIATTRNTRAQ